MVLFLLLVYLSSPASYAVFDYWCEDTRTDADVKHFFTSLYHMIITTKPDDQLQTRTDTDSKESISCEMKISRSRKGSISWHNSVVSNCVTNSQSNTYKASLQGTEIKHQSTEPGESTADYLDMRPIQDDCSDVPVRQMVLILVICVSVLIASIVIIVTIVMVVLNRRRETCSCQHRTEQTHMIMRDLQRFEQEEDDDVDARTPDKMTTKSAPKVISPYMVSNNLPDIMIVPRSPKPAHTYDEIEHIGGCSSGKKLRSSHQQHDYYNINLDGSQKPFNMSGTSSSESMTSICAEQGNMTSSRSFMMSSSCEDSGVTSPGSTVLDRTSADNLISQDPYDVSEKLLNDTILVDNDLYIS